MKGLRATESRIEAGTAKIATKSRLHETRPSTIQMNRRPNRRPKIAVLLVAYPISGSFTAFHNE